MDKNKNGLFLAGDTVDVLFIVSVLITRDGEAPYHFPVLVAARSPEKASAGVLSRAEELYPRAAGYSHSVTEPELFIDLLKAVAAFAKEGA